MVALVVKGRRRARKTLRDDGSRETAELADLGLLYSTESKSFQDLPACRNYSIMPATLTGIAIIGKNNEPLYLCDCHKESSSDAAANIEDPFDFKQALTEQRNSMSLQLQLVVYAALDSLEEMVSTGQTKQQPIIKKPNVAMTNWVGLLLELDGQAVYSSVTATNIKFFALTEGRSEVKVIQGLLKVSIYRWILLLGLLNSSIHNNLHQQYCASATYSRKFINTSFPTS